MNITCRVVKRYFKIIFNSEEIILGDNIINYRYVAINSFTFDGLSTLWRIYKQLQSLLFALIQPYFFSNLQKRRSGKSLIFLGFLLSFLPSFFILFAVQVGDFTSKYTAMFLLLLLLLLLCTTTVLYGGSITTKMKRVAETHSQPYIVLDFSWFKVAREFRRCSAT